MTKRDSNITLNLTDDNEPAVTHQNPDGSITEYATPKDPPGSATAENVPSPLAAEINAFTDAIDHPEEFTDTALHVIGVARLNSNLSNSALSERLDVSASTVSRVCLQADLAELSDRKEIHATFRERTDRQQAIIKTLVINPDCSRDDLVEVGECSRSAAGGIQRTFAPLVHHLREVGLPAEYDASSEVHDKDGSHEESLTESSASVSQQASTAPADTGSVASTDGNDESASVSALLDEIRPAVRTAVNEDDATISETLDTVSTLIEHPTAYTETDLLVMVLDRLRSDLSITALAEHIDQSATTVRRARAKTEMAALSDRAEVHEYFRGLAEFKQNVIIAAVQHPDSSRSTIAELAGTSASTANTQYTEYKPLIHQLRGVGLPAELSDQFESTDPAATETTSSDSSLSDNTSRGGSYACSMCGKTFETANKRNGHKAVHTTQSLTSPDTLVTNINGNNGGNESNGNDVDNGNHGRSGHDEDDSSTSVDDNTESDSATHTADTNDDLADLKIELDDRSPDAESTPTTASAAETTHSIPRSEINQLRQFVAGLRDTAITEYTHSESPIGQQSTAARRAICETILDSLDTILDNKPHSSSEGSV